MARKVLTEVDLEKKYQTVVTSGQAALKALLTMNGGGTIAFLTLVGHLGEKGIPISSVDLFVAALKMFIFGTLFTVLAYGMIFFTNCLSYGGFKKWSNFTFGLTVACGVASLVFFIIASGRAVLAFQSVTAAVKL